MDQDRFYNLISGASKGPLPALLRVLLGLGAAFYAAVVDVRNSCYCRGIFKAYRVTRRGAATSHKSGDFVPVISVGNVTTGGTGKTPMVVWLCRHLRRKGLQAAVLTRGYKAGKGLLSDEPAMLVRNCPDTPVVVNANRVRGAVEAITKHGVQAIIMDDGFQHRRLARDIDIVAIDAARPFGFGKLLPAGLLREPVTSLKRAHVAVITKADQLPEYALTKLENTIRRVNPNMLLARAVHQPICAKTTDNGQLSLEQLKSKTVFAFCGIANPDSFFTAIRQLGCNLVGSKALDDHHRYTNQDIALIREAAERAGAEVILTTEKDWNKVVLQIPAGSELRFAYLAVEMRFIVGEDKLTQLIERTITGRIAGEKNIDERRG